MDSRSKTLCCLAIIAVILVAIVYKNRSAKKCRPTVVMLTTPDTLAATGNLALIEPVPRFSPTSTAQLEKDAYLAGFGMGPGLIDSNRYASNPPPL